ncbi:MAG TPA: glycosyltransferase [bacterium]|nr:glycosyltransferase [bacterium]HOL47260.1 glycosyltransferase [bacterium]HPQ19625.1 glycosyltransferase [bacterium]
MKILWFTFFDSVDIDIISSFQNTDIKIIPIIPTQDEKFSGYMPIKIVKEKLIKRINCRSEEILKYIKENKGINYIICRPIENNYCEEIIKAADKVKIPALMWVTEQGPLRDLIIERAKIFKYVIVNNIYDIEHYKKIGFDKIYYMPFCCDINSYKRARILKKFKVDIHISGHPMYNFFPSKRASLEILLKPLIEKNFNCGVWGPYGDDSYGGGWSKVPYVTSKIYKGKFEYEEYPSAVKSSKIILGITANAPYGGYGSRLVTTLGNKGFLLWQYTKGIENDFINHKHLCWSNSAEETIDICSYYLKKEDKRIKIAEAGQNFVYENYTYIKYLPSILSKIKEDYEKTSFSNYFLLKNTYEKDKEKLIDEIRKNKKDKYYYEIYFLIGNYHLEKGNNKKAREYYKKALKYKKRAEILNNIGVCFVKEGKIKLGLQKFKEALEIRKDYNDANHNYLMVKETRKDEIKITKSFFRT